MCSETTLRARPDSLANLNSVQPRTAKAELTKCSKLKLRFRKLSLFLRPFAPTELIGIFDNQLCYICGETVLKSAPSCLLETFALYIWVERNCFCPSSAWH